MGSSCLACGGTGYKLDGSVCECGSLTKESRLPTGFDIPVQYQELEFDKNFMEYKYQDTLGIYLETLIRDICEYNNKFQKNVLICSPVGTSKSVFSYTLLGRLYAQGYEVMPVLDMYEVQDLLSYRYKDKPVEQISRLFSAHIVILRIPAELPRGVFNTMHTVIERRVRNSLNTIFMYSGDINDLKAQDTFNKLESIIGTGSFNTIEVKNFGGK